MLVAMRISLVVMVVATACAAPDATTGDDDGSGSGSNVGLQCSAAWSCATPATATKQTICGQLYDLETSAAFVGSTQMCTTPTASGPCSLAIEAYDAIAFGQNPGAAAPLAHGPVEIDGCGRYRIPDIDVSGIGPFIGVSVDDAAGRGISGTTVPVAVATPKIAGTATDGLEAWIVRESTTTQWAASGGPLLANGVFVPMFRAHMVGTPQTDPFEMQSGVTLTKNNNVADDYYFGVDSMERTTIDTAAVATGANGTALVTNASIADGVAYSGTGGLSDETSCRWEHHVGFTAPNTVFVQIFRPANVVGQTCSL